MKFFLYLIAGLILSPATYAQSTLPTPPPQNRAVNSPASVAPLVAPIAEKLGFVFSDLDKQIIRDTLGAVNQVVTGQKTASNSETDPDDAERSRDGQGAKSKHKRKDKGQGKGKGKHNKMPPGLAKRDKLPPGLQKQLERNGKLPPGLQKRALPDNVIAKLPPPKKGTERVIVDKDVVLMDTVTNTVLDIIRNVVLK